MAETLPIGTDLDTCYITPSGGGRTLLKEAVLGGTVASSVPPGSTINSPIVTNGTLINAFDFSVNAGVTTAGSTQATATQLTNNIISNIATSTAGQGYNLPASVAGRLDFVINSGTADVTSYPLQGETSTINSFAATIGVLHPAGALGFFESTTAGTIKAYGITPKKSAYLANTASAAATVTAVSMVGADIVNVIDMTGSIATQQNLTTPSAAALLAAMPFGNTAKSSVLRVKHSGAGAGAWNLTGGTGVTVSGTATIAQTTWREFNLAFVNGTSCVATNMGGGSIV